MNGKQSLSINAFQFTAELAGAEVKESGQTSEEVFFEVRFPETNSYLIAVDEGGRVRLQTG